MNRVINNYLQEGDIVRNQYKVVKFLKRGAFGQIYIVSDENNNNNLYALKMITRDKLCNDKLRSLYDNEVNILKSLKHPNICCYQDNFEDTRYNYLILEYCSQGDLLEKLNATEKRRFTQEQALYYMKQILSAFKQLHSLKRDSIIIHRDIKLENILLHDDKAKLGDFGFAREIQKSSDIGTTWCGSLYTMAPEVMISLPHGIKVDVYSLGIILYQMLFGNFPYQYQTEEKMIRAIKKGKIPFDVYNLGCSQDIKNLIKKMLIFDVQKRISFEELYQLPYFRDENIENQILSKSTNAKDTASNQKKLYNLNLKFLGDSNVGKSSLLFRYCSEKYDNNLQNTVGIDFQMKIIEKDNTQYYLKLWDTAGQERFQAISQSYLKDCDGFILVFDYICLESILNIQKWIELTEDYKTPLIILGNKYDIREQSENFQLIQNLVTVLKQYWTDKGIQFRNVSAKTNLNINESIGQFIQYIINDKSYLQSGIESYIKIKGQSGYQSHKISLSRNSNSKKPNQGEIPDNEQPTQNNCIKNGACC